MISIQANMISEVVFVTGILSNPRKTFRLKKRGFISNRIEYLQDLRMRYEKLGFEIASLSVAMTEILCTA